MLRLARYNSRHCLWFPRGSKYGAGKIVRLNPIESSSHNERHQRTFYLYEPLWLFRLRQHLFAFGGRQRCSRRDDNPMLTKHFGADKALPDTWDIGPDGNRTCSYCGSIHPDDLMAICRKTLTDERYGVEGTGKGYKVYVRQPGVRNASEGAIKFYMHHLPTAPSKADQELFAKAFRATSRRFMERIKAPMTAGAA